MAIKRTKDGYIEDVLTMGDLLAEEELTPEEIEQKKRLEELRKKYKTNDYSNS